MDDAKDNNIKVSRREFFKILGATGIVLTGGLFGLRSLLDEFATKTVLAQKNITNTTVTTANTTLTPPNQEKELYPYLQIEHRSDSPLPSQLPTEERFIIHNDGNVTSWSCHIEVYGGVANDGTPFGSNTPLSQFKILGQKVITLQPGAHIEVSVPTLWNNLGSSIQGVIVIGVCYDPVIDPLEPHDTILIGQNNRKISSFIYLNPIIIPYLDKGYKFKVVPRGEGEVFEQPEFDDSNFSIGDAGFGTARTETECRLNNANHVSTEWPINTDILLRKEFNLPTTEHNLKMGVAIDNDIQVFINGRDISNGLRQHEGCATHDSFTFNAPSEILVEGTNLVAVRGQDRGGLSYLDIQLNYVLE